MLTLLTVVPLRNIDCEHLNMKIYAEEGNKDEDNKFNNLTSLV